MKAICLLSAVIIFITSNVCLADSPAPPNAARLLGLWEKASTNGDKISLTFKANNTVEVTYPIGQVHSDITMWRLKGDTVLLFSSTGDLKGRMDPTGRLIIVGPTFGKPLYDLVLIRKN
jgi:hypothetical protein